MSNPIRYDPLLVRALAAELRDALQGRAAHPLPVFDSDVSATLPLDRGEALRVDLHPRRGWIRVVPADAGEGARVRADSEASARVVRVSAPPDERLLRIDLHEGGRFRGGRRTLVLELHTNQWNALLVDGDDGRIVSVLRPREAGGRVLHAGEVYHPPSPPGRILPDSADEDALRATWRDELGPIPPADRPRALIRRFAYTSPLNAAHVLARAADSDDGDALDDAFGRWIAMASHPSRGAFLLRRRGGIQPYPIALEGCESKRADSLLGAMDAAAEDAGEDEAGSEAAALLEGARRRVDAAARRIDSLRSEVADEGEEERLRGMGDLLLAHLHLVKHGAEAVTLTGFDGEEVEVRLDPSLRPHENAERFYAQARRRARARERIPALVAEAERERDRWLGAVDALEAGDVPAWVAPALAKSERKPSQTTAAGPRLPYRPYRTSGGLEVRVGRGSKDNDRLTFGHCAPGDVWLHARSVPGSHVVLRWQEEGAPPARDLEEAAVLAALYSKARTSGTVAVDWTRRRYVRKPRGAGPGRVTLLQAKTVFVEPDEAVEERMRVE